MSNTAETGLSRLRSSKFFVRDAIQLNLCLVLAVTFAYANTGEASAKLNELKIWQTNSTLKRLATGLNPLKRPVGDGALGINQRFPERVVVSHQAEGWNWILFGVALGNGFMIDRGIMAFEWAFARMSEDGAFGESKTVEISNFLGLYARSVLFLRNAKQDSRAQRLARLIPRLEKSLRSSRSLVGEKRWNTEELRSWATHQRVQAAAAAYWIGQLLVNPGLNRTFDIWLNEALKRQEATGFFPSGFPADSKAALIAQLEILECLQGLASRDSFNSVKLRQPIENGFRWIEKSPLINKVPLNPSGLVTIAWYAAWSGNRFATNLVATRLKGLKF
jgi:hypothetical protein